MKNILTCFFIVFHTLMLQSTPIFSRSFHNVEKTPENHLKPIMAEVEELPNFLWHLFASANLWEKSESIYRKLYGDLIPQEDIDFLFNHREHIVWGNGRSGKYARLLFFMPLGRTMEVDQYFDYLNFLSSCSSRQNIPEFSKKYGRNEFDSKYLSDFPFDSTDIVFFKKFREIIISNHKIFHEHAWPKVLPILESDQRFINQYFSSLDIVGQWENLLNMPFEGELFSPVLTYANAVDNLPSANNLSNSRNNFGVSGNADNYLLELVVHEVGIYILMPVIIELFNNPNLQTQYIQENNLIYQAIESYIEFLKRDITGTSQLWKGDMHGGGEFDFERFFRYYKEASLNDSDVAQILEGAIMQYNN